MNAEPRDAMLDLLRETGDEAFQTVLADPPWRFINRTGKVAPEHSRKPDEQYDVIKDCSSGPYLELFARGTRPGWKYWGNQADENYKPTWKTYPYNSSVAVE